MNTLYYGDNLDILRSHIKGETVDLIYLDPPFNSKADYNLLYKEPTGEQSGAQITAFEDTWHWNEKTAETFQEIIDIAPSNVVEMMTAFRQFVGMNDMMAYLTMMCVRFIELRRVLKDTGSIYLHCDPTASHYLKVLMDTIFGKLNFRNEIVWHYSGWNKKLDNHFEKRSDTILFYSKSEEQKFNSYTLPWKNEDEYVKVRKQKVRDDGDGNLYVLSDAGGGKRVKRYLGEAMQYGIPIDNVWDIDKINNSSKEKLGYPTQKPELLLERIIKSSSDEGDIVLDPFCGCGTTIAVAQELKRKWIGIDITHLAINLIKSRLKSKFKEHSDFTVVGEPEDLAGAKDLAKLNRYQFQWWALSLIEAKPYGDKKKGKDTGIDGYIYLNEGPDSTKKGIVQVKSGAVGVKDIRDLGHTISREKAVIGIFITLEAPTRDMAKEATTKGFYTYPFNGQKYPTIQIITIEDLLKGNKPNIPPTVAFHKKASPIVDQKGDVVAKHKNLPLF